MPQLTSFFIQQRGIIWDQDVAEEAFIEDDHLQTVLSMMAGEDTSKETYKELFVTVLLVNYCLVLAKKYPAPKPESFSIHELKN